MATVLFLVLYLPTVEVGRCRQLALKTMSPEDTLKDFEPLYFPKQRPSGRHLVEFLWLPKGRTFELRARRSGCSECRIEVFTKSVSCLDLSRVQEQIDAALRPSAVRSYTDHLVMTHLRGNDRYARRPSVKRCYEIAKAWREYARVRDDFRRGPLVNKDLLEIRGQLEWKLRDLRHAQSILEDGCCGYHDTR